MQTRKVRSMGLAVSILVPATIAEFNVAAKNGKGEDGSAVLAIAIDQYVAHSWLTDFRYNFLHGITATEASEGVEALPAVQGVEQFTGIERKVVPVNGKDGKPRLKDGEPVTAFDESEGDYFKRVIATLIKTGKFANEEQAIASFQHMADAIADRTPVDLTESERKERGPIKLAAKYKIAAARALALGSWSKLNTGAFTKIGKVFSPAVVADGETAKQFTGKYPIMGPDGKTPTEVDFSVADADAETLGRLIKEYQDWKAQQELAELV